MTKSRLVKEKESYWDKKCSYGDDPLLEIIYELEDIVFWAEKPDTKVIDYYEAQEILHRHINTVKKFYKKHGIKKASPSRRKNGK